MRKPARETFGVYLALAAVLLGLLVGGAWAQQVGLEEIHGRARREGQVVFYTSQVGVDEQRVVAGFRSRYPGINVEVVYAGGGALYERITAEARAGRNLADAHLQSDVALMERLRVAGLLAQWDPPEAEGYSPQDKKAGYWTAVANVVNVIIYNRARIAAQDAPRTWRGLLDPKWKGRVAAVHIGGGGVPWAKYWFLRTQIDPNYWQSLAANTPVFYDGGGAVLNAVVTGTSDIGILANSISYGAIQQGAPLVEVVPSEGVPGVLYTIGVLRAAPHPNAARMFSNWYLSKDGQTRLSFLRGVVSPRSDVPRPPEGINPATTKVFIPPLDEVQRLRDAWSEEWFRIFRYRP